MKLKSFGLIEAIIGSAIVIIFVVAMAYVSVRANQILIESKHRQVAQKISDDFFSRIFMLRDSGRISFKQGKLNNQVIPINCFSTDSSENCKSTLLDSYPQNQAPFFDMISNQSVGSYKLFKSEYLAPDEAKSDFYKIKVQVDKTSCGKDKDIEISPESCRNVNLEIIWQESSGLKKFTVDQYIADL